MDLVIVACTAGRQLARQVADHLGTTPVDSGAQRFPDGELGVAIDGEVRGGDAYLVQPLAPPANDNLVELLLTVDAARRAGARRVTAVVPYIAYARQDRRTAAGEPVSIRLVGDLLRAAGVERAITVDPHTPDIESILGLTVEITTAVPTLAGALRDEVDEETVVVAPDLGAVELAEEYAEALGRSVAIVRKTRVSGDEVETAGIVGEVAGRRALLVDDMISTGGTLVAAAEALERAGAAQPLDVAATHGLLVADATEQLDGLPLRRLLIADTLPTPDDRPEATEVVSIASVLAEAVVRLHEERPVAPLEAYR